MEVSDRIQGWQLHLGNIRHEAGQTNHGPGSVRECAGALCPEGQSQQSPKVPGDWPMGSWQKRVPGSGEPSALT